METILLYRDKAAKIYNNYEFIFKLAAKFVFILMTLNYLTEHLGYYDVLNIMSIRLFIAVVCAFLPVPFGVFVAGMTAVLHLMKLSMILGVLSIVVFLIVYFLYLRFAPSQGIFMLAVAVLSPFHLQYAVAFILGMFYSPVTAIPVALTIVLMRFVSCVQLAAPEIGSSFDMEKILKGYQSIVDGMMSDKSMLLMIAALAIIIVLTYVISQMPFDYSWYAAIAVAAVVNIFVIFFGNSMLNTDISVGSTLIGTVAGAVIAAFLQFMKCVVDYPKKEFVQFEDDDYYYYVKALPKVGSKPVYTEEDGDHVPEELDDKRAAMKKKAAKKASKNAAKAVKAEKKAKNEVSAPVRGAGRNAAGSDGQSEYKHRQSGQSAAYDDGGFDDYGFYDEETPKF